MTAGHGARPSPIRVLVDPFARLGPGATAALAAVAVLLGFAASRVGVRFDGALDMHPAGAPVPLGTALADQGAALLAPALVGWAVLRTLGAPAPLGRVLAVLGAARLPLVLAFPLVFVPLLARPRGPAMVMLTPGSVPPPPSLIPFLAMLGAGLVTLAAFVWFVALAVAGLRATGGLRGGRLAAASAAALLGGELIAKLALALP